MGSYTHSLDPKKRLTIPSEWRENVGTPNSLYVLPGLGLANRRYLSVFPASKMAERLKKISSLSVADTKGRQFARLLGSQSQLAPWDSAGRIRISDSLLGYGNLLDQVELVGVIDHFELWNADEWKQVGAMGISELRESALNIQF